MNTREQKVHKRVRDTVMGLRIAVLHGLFEGLNARGMDNILKKRLGDLPDRVVAVIRTGKDKKEQ